MNEQCQNFNVNFHKFHTLFSKRLSQTGYHKFSPGWVPQLVMGVHKMQGMASALILFKQYYKDDNEFLSHMV
jgi:hypothetical protein